MTRKSASAQIKEDWLNCKWRPMMGWLYMFVCFFDFVLAPVLWTIIQAYFKGGIAMQWQPLTLQGGGLFHIAMGAVIGINAYGRTQEKLGGGNQQLGTQYVQPGGSPTGFGGYNNGKTTTTTPGYPSGSPAYGATTTGYRPQYPGNGFGNAPLPSTAPTTNTATRYNNVPTPPVVSKFGKVVPQDDQPAL